MLCPKAGRVMLLDSDPYTFPVGNLEPKPPFELPGPPGAGAWNPDDDPPYPPPNCSLDPWPPSALPGPPGVGAWNPPDGDPYPGLEIGVLLPNCSLGAGAGAGASPPNRDGGPWFAPTRCTRLPHFPGGDCAACWGFVRRRSWSPRAVSLRGAEVPGAPGRSFCR